MDTDSRNELDRILHLHDSELTENDKGFLRARRSYLTRAERNSYADILGEEPVIEDDKPAKTQYKTKDVPPVTPQPEQSVMDKLAKASEPAAPVQPAPGDEGQAECLDPDCTIPEHNHTT